MVQIHIQKQFTVTNILHSNYIFNKTEGYTMKIKKYILLFLVFVMCTSVFIFPCGVSAAENVSLNVLSALGIIPSDEISMQKEITRAEAARYVMGMLNRGEEAQRDTIFSDVKADHKYSGVIAAALEMGIVSHGELFRPDEKATGKEFIKMLVEAIGYKNMAVSSGGYPDGYIFTAERVGILDDVILAVDGYVSFDVASLLLENALNAPILNEIVTIDSKGNFNFGYEGARKTETFLYKKMNIRVFNVFVEEMHADKKTAEVTLISEKTKTDNSEYILGAKYSFNFSVKADFEDFSHAYAKMWINENEEIVFLELENNTEIRYAYIDEINEVHEVGALSEVREIHNIALVDDEEYIDVASDCRFYFEGKYIETGSIPYMGAFARVVIYKDEIISIEGFSLNEGGIINSVDNGLIIYKNSKWDDKKYDSHALSKETKVIINGKPESYWGIASGMLFDYCEYDEKVLIVVSSRTVTDNFNARTENALFFGGEQYKRSEIFSVGCSTDGVSFIKPVSENELLGELVTAYLDLSGRVRFLSIPVYNEENSEFYGLILGYNEDLFEEEAEFKVFRVYKDRVEERILGVSKSVMNTSDFDKAKASALSLRDGNLNENLKSNNDITWKIRAINGKIVSLKEAELFDQSPEEGITSVTYIPGGTTPYISSPRIYFDGAVLCALFYDDYLGKLSAKILTPEDIHDKTFSGVRMDFYNKANTSEIELALFRGDVKTIATNRADLINIGIMKFINYTEGKEGNSAATIKILDDGTYTVPALSVEGAEMYSMVKYAENVAIPDESPINIVEIIAGLSGSPYGWDAQKTSTSSTAPDGFYTDIVTKCDGRRVFFETLTDENDKESNVRYYVNITTDYYVYRVTDNPENRFEKVSINEVEPGMRVWYGLRNQFISFIIIE